MAGLKKVIADLREDFMGNVLRVDRTSFENIQQIEKLTGKKLNAVLLKDIRKNNNSYAVGITGKLKGLNLDVSGIKGISFLNSLSLSGLTHLSLTFNQIADLTPLSTLTNLTVLSLNGDQFKDLSQLSTLTKLHIKELYLINIQIENLTPLGRLTNLTVLGLSGDQFKDLSSLSTLTNLKELYLVNNQIEDLTPLGRLTNLTVLGLSGDQFKDLSPLNTLTNLHIKELYLVNNQIEDLTPLGRLTNLIVLDVRGNQIMDLAPLSQLTRLESLLLENNQIEDLTPLSVLTNLIWLNLDGNRITVLAPLRKLTQLKKLFLSHNQIEDITPLSDLTYLEELRLTDNQIADISPLSGLIELNSISLTSNRIIELSPLIPLTGLKKLWLANNKIYDLKSLKALKQLEILGVRINEITDFTPLKELTNLIGLDISRNNITRLPLGIDLWWSNMEINWVDMPTNVGLNLYGNPLTDPPIGVVKKGKTYIENYFAEIKAASVLFLESKLLLVGSGDVGKTTLMKKLKNNRFKVKPGKEDTTRGIDIQPWQLTCPFPDGIPRDVKIHFWDFGGQDILHATHQFFFIKRSLYLLVWAPRNGGEPRDFDYWLNAVKLLAASSPLIMVMNKADIRIKHIDEASFQGKFPNIAQFRQISCLNGQQIPELTQDIQHTLGQMPHLLDELPKRWKDIRDELKARKEDFITQRDYFSVCRNHGMDEEKALFLSDYLHDLGIILHFQHDLVLSGTVILKPEWATGAVYALIDSLEIQKNGGRFNSANLGCYWDKKKYPADKHTHLLRLIEKFELCFNIVGTYDYILPELLPVKCQAIETEIYRSPGNLQLHYSYDFMPAGIITRFISRLHYLIRDDHYWNTGVELVFSGSSALVVSDTAQNRIYITVAGVSKTQLMGIIRSHFDHIHETLNMKKDEHLFEEVPCNCSQCKTSEKPYFYEYNLLQKLMLKNRDAFCKKSSEDVFVHNLLNGFLPPKEPGNLFDLLVVTLSQLQGINKTVQPDENSRNTVVASFLKARGFRVLDQTLHGSAASGHGLGELDMKIEDEIGRTLSIIEALNLDCCDTTQIDRHILKLLQRYDPSGLKANYILVYVSVNNFPELCHNYQEHLRKIDYKIYPLKKKIEEVHTGFNKIKAFRALHQCNDGETYLCHLLVEM